MTTPKGHTTLHSGNNNPDIQPQTAQAMPPGSTENAVNRLLRESKTMYGGNRLRVIKCFINFQYNSGPNHFLSCT